MKVHKHTFKVIDYWRLQLVTGVYNWPLESTIGHWSLQFVLTITNRKALLTSVCLLCLCIIIIIIITTITIIIITIISFMQGIYTYIPETNYVPREYRVAAILLLIFMVLISSVSVLNLLYFHISTFRSVCVQCPIWLFSGVP